MAFLNNALMRRGASLRSSGPCVPMHAPPRCASRGVCHVALRPRTKRKPPFAPPSPRRRGLCPVTLRCTAHTPRCGRSRRRPPLRTAAAARRIGGRHHVQARRVLFPCPNRRDVRHPTRIPKRARYPRTPSVCLFRGFIRDDGGLAMERCAAPNDARTLVRVRRRDENWHASLLPQTLREPPTPNPS